MSPLNHIALNTELEYSSAITQIDSAADALQAINSALQVGTTQAALNLCERAINQWPNDIELLIAGAHLAKSIGRNVAAVSLLSRAATLGSAKALRDKQMLIDVAAPYWHFRMMNDEVRNNAYDAAIKHYVSPDSLVLDIGCGAGLLSMMSARAGAQHVYACEVHELMHNKAEIIFAKNNFSNQITAFHSNSAQLKVGPHLPRKADIIVAEIFDSGLLGEEALATFAHAREHLLAPGGRILPAKASIQAQLIESDLMYKEAASQYCSGFDVSELNSLSPSYVQIRVNTHEHRFLSNVETVLNFNFEKNETENRDVKHQFICQRDGLCHGIAFWFTLDFDQGTTLSTGPENTWNCWKQAMCNFDTPRQVLAGDALLVTVSSTANRISFALTE